MNNGAYIVGSDIFSTKKDGYEGMFGSSSFSYGSNTNVSMKNSTGDVNECTDQLEGYSLARDQYSHILQMLKQIQGHGHKIEDASQIHETHANNVGKSLLVS